ncbi:MAG: FAD:protein FMN transferase [Gemmataceae bacterium]
MSRLTRRELMRAGLAGLGMAAVPHGVASAAEDRPTASFHHDHVVGTSLDGYVVTDNPARAARAERVVLAEIERLRQVFSTRDPDSELSRLNRSTGAFVASADLLAVLGEYERWQRRSAGACSPACGALIRAWAEAERRGREPAPATLAARRGRTGVAAGGRHGRSHQRRTARPELGRQGLHPPRRR